MQQKCTSEKAFHEFCQKNNRGGISFGRFGEKLELSKSTADDDRPHDWWDTLCHKIRRRELENVKQLYLSNNEIDCKMLKMLVDAMTPTKMNPEWALPDLRGIHLSLNGIAGPGMKSLLDAIAEGALAKLQRLGIFENSDGVLEQLSLHIADKEFLVNLVLLDLNLNDYDQNDKNKTLIDEFVKQIANGALRSLKFLQVFIYDPNWSWGRRPGFAPVLQGACDVRDIFLFYYSKNRPLSMNDLLLL